MDDPYRKLVFRNVAIGVVVQMPSDVMQGWLGS